MEKNNNKNIRKKNPNKTNHNNNKNQIKIMALGGMGQVGKNCYVVEYKKDIFIIDFGVLFPSEEHIGIDYIIPNYTYLKENESRIKALLITHGHEDHIGGVPFLLKKIKIENIYAPKMAKFLIEKKIKEHKLNNVVKELSEDITLKFGEVALHTFHQTHSIPNSIGLFFETPLGNVATTGDFKVDFSPSGEEQTNFHKITKLSEKGVLCLLSDSTNSLKEGFSPSSDEIGENLKILIKEAEGRILFTTFASHINRVQKIVEGCLENNRKICVLGRSMKNNLKIGMKAKYINLKNSDIIDLKEVKNYPPEQVCIISTGSQGEPLAALSRIAHGLNNNITLSSDDTIVFASSPIPGNNYQIGKVIDQLYKTECKVITNTSYFKTHTSGHASKEEQKLMLSLFKPDYFLPIHGNYFMLFEHKKTAMSIGMEDENIFLFDNGDVLTFEPNKKPIVTRSKVPGQSIYISGNNINVSLEKSNMNQLATDGILIVSLLLDKNKKIISYPQITTRGFVIINKKLDLLKKIQKQFITIYNNSNNEDFNVQKKEIISKLSKFIYNNTQKTPYIYLNVIDYNPKEKK